MRAGSAVVLGICLGGCHCTSSSSPKVQVDSSADALDAGADTVPDGHGDTRDSTPDRFDVHDSDASGGFGPFVGTWVGLPGADFCDTLFAKDPAASVPPLHWASCSSGRSGCRVLVVDWTTPGDWSLDFLPGRLATATAYILYTRRYTRSDGINVDYGMEVIQPIDAPPIAALGVDARKTDPCHLAMLIGDFGLVISSGHLTEYPNVQMITAAPWPDLGALSTTLVPFSELGAGSETDLFEVGDTRVFLSLMFDGMAVFDPVAGAVVPPAPSRPPASRPVPVTGGAFVRDFMANTLGFVNDDASWSDVVPPKSGRSIAWLEADRSNGGAPVWLEIDAGGCPGCTPILYTSPYGTTSSTVTPRAVAKISSALSDIGTNMIANAGVALVRTSDATAVLYRMSDGVGWTITSEPGEKFIEPIWADDNEVWLETTSRVDGQPSGAMRLRRDVLGPPDVSSGL